MLLPTLKDKRGILIIFYSAMRENQFVPTVRCTRLIARSPVPVIRNRLPPQLIDSDRINLHQQARKRNRAKVPKLKTRNVYRQIRSEHNAISMSPLGPAQPQARALSSSLTSIFSTTLPFQHIALSLTTQASTIYGK